MSTIDQTAYDTSARSLMAFIGAFAVLALDCESWTFVNKEPQAAQVSTITVDTGTNDYTYKVTVDGWEVSYLADSSTSTTEVATGLAAAINADPVIYAKCSATSATNVVTVTGRYAGLSFTVAESDTGAKLTIATTTAAAAASAVSFGLGLMEIGSADTDSGVRYACVAASSKFTAQVDTVTATYASGETYTVEIVIEGKTYIAGPVAADTNTATTAAAIIAAVNAIMPANSVNATGSSTVVLTAEVAGKGFQTSVGSKSGGNITLANTTAHSQTAPTDITKCFRGVSLAGDSELSAVGSTTGQWPANSAMKVARRGPVWVANTQTVTPASDVYIELGSSNSGQFYNTTSSTRVKLPSSLVQWGSPDRSGIAAQLRVTL